MGLKKLVLGNRIESPADLFEKSRKLKNANKAKSDLRTFEQRDAVQSKKAFKTKEDIVAETYYAFETDDLTPRINVTLEDRYGEIIQNEDLDGVSDENIYEPKTPNIVPSGTNRGVSMSPDTKTYHGWNISETPGYKSKESRSVYNKKAREGKKKSKMRKRNYRKIAQQSQGLSPQEINKILSQSNTLREVLQMVS